MLITWGLENGSWVELPDNKYFPPNEMWALFITEVSIVNENSETPYLQFWWLWKDSDKAEHKKIMSNVLSVDILF